MKLTKFYINIGKTAEILAIKILNDLGCSIIWLGNKRKHSFDILAIGKTGIKTRFEIKHILNDYQLKSYTNKCPNPIADFTMAIKNVHQNQDGMFCYEKYWIIPNRKDARAYTESDIIQEATERFFENPNCKAGGKTSSCRK